MQSLDRALSLLTTLAAQGTNGTPLKVLSEAAGMHVSTAHHLLATLLARGFVSQDHTTRHYRLGPGVLTLAHQFLSECDLATLGAPALTELHRRFGEWVLLAVLEGGQVHMVFQLQSSQPLVINAGRGDSRGLHRTAIGKVFLAGMSPTEVEAVIAAQGGLTPLTRHSITNQQALMRELKVVRERGYAVNREENNEGMVGFAAPVRDLTGRVVAGLGLAVPTLRLPSEREQEILAAVLAAARALSASLGWVAPDAAAREL